MGYAEVGKRGFDLILVSTALVLALPFLLLLALLIHLDDGGPALFRQTRVGRNGSSFTLLKFRSMPVTAANLPSAAAAGLRVTRIGRLIRRYSLDELPQLLNILRGDMSLVGPRPALPAQEILLALRAANGAARVRPGLTGLAQISSYDGMPETEKAALDGRYAARVTLLRDVSIILRTFRYLGSPPPTY